VAKRGKRARLYFPPTGKSYLREASGNLVRFDSFNLKVVSGGVYAIEVPILSATLRTWAADLTPLVSRVVILDVHLDGARLMGDIVKQLGSREVVIETEGIWRWRPSGR